MSDPVAERYIADLERTIDRLNARLFQVENEAIALATANSDLRSELHDLREAVRHG